MVAQLRPGEYLRRRREAAGLSVRDVAVMISTGESWIDFNTLAIGLIEDAGEHPGVTMLNRLRHAFAYDFYVYTLLLAGWPVHVCRICACSALDACDDETTGACGWSADDPELCTHCAGRLAVGDVLLMSKGSRDVA